MGIAIKYAVALKKKFYMIQNELKMLSHLDI